MNFRIIGLCGRQGAGKNEVYNLLSIYSSRNKQCVARFNPAAFADALKECAQAAFGGNSNNYWGTEEYKNEIIEPWGVSGRQIMQFLGTEMFRDHVKELCPKVGDNFWVIRLAQKLEQKSLISPEIIHCITDVRFQNEADWVISNGGIILRINREGLPNDIGLKNHRSESGLTITIKDKGRYYEIDNNGTRPNLLKNTLEVITQYFDLYH